MRCKKAQIRLQGYVDGELSPRRVKQVRRHVDRCPACAERLAQLSALKTLLAEDRLQPEMDGTAEFFWSQVSGRIEGEVKPRQQWQRSFHLNWPRVLAWTSACVVVGAVASFVSLQSLPKRVDVVAAPPVASAPAAAQVDSIVTKGPELYAQAYHSKQSQATIIWTEGMPVISLEF